MELDMLKFSVMDISLQLRAMCSSETNSPEAMLNPWTSILLVKEYNFKNTIKRDLAKKLSHVYISVRI